MLGKGMMIQNTACVEFVLMFKYFDLIKPIKSNKGFLTMASVCEVCGKHRNKSNKVSFSNKHHRFFQQPNLQSCKVVLANGVRKTIRVCTGCIRAGKIRRAG
jgi:large subunit ribosomal protein L28